MNRLIVAAAVVLVGTVACHRSIQPPAARPEPRPLPWLVMQARPNSIVGMVVGDSGRPLAESQVILDTSRHAFTDTSGRFQFLNVPAAWHTIRVLHVGYIQQREVEKTVDGSGLALVVRMHEMSNQLNYVCTTELRPNLRIVVHPIRLLQTSSLAAGIPRGIVIRIVDRDYNDVIHGDSLPPPNEHGDLIAWSDRRGERAGVYIVEVAAPGYRFWRRTGIRVVQDECHVTTQTVDVTLEPMTTKHE